MALAALLVGAPVLLVIGVGWPLPTSAPSWHEVARTFSQQGVPGRLVIDGLAVVCWAMWAIVAASFVVELAAIARRRRAPRLPLAGPMQGLVGHLVAVAAVAVLSLGSARHTASPPQGSAPLAAVIARSTPAQTSRAALLQSAQPAPPQRIHVVQRGETLWGIAGRELHDELRWRELFTLNRGRPQPDGGRLSNPDKIFAGWRLVLPPDAPPAPAPAPAPRAPAGDHAAPQAPVAAIPTPPPAPPTTLLPSPAVPPTPGSGKPSRAEASSSVAVTPMPPRSVPRLRGEVVELPSGGLVALSYAAGVGSALALARLRRRRGYRPAEPRPKAGPPPPEPVGRLALQLRRVASAAASRAVDDDHDDNDDRRVASIPAEAPPPAESEVLAPPGTVTLGETDGGATVRVDLPALGGVGIAGPAADDLMRALVLECVMQGASGAEVDLFIADELAASVGGSLDRAPRVRTFATTADALLAAEVELTHRTRLSHETGVRDHAPLAARIPEEPLPIVVLVVRAGSPHDGRLEAILQVGRRLGIAALVLGDWSSGVSVEVGADGTVERVAASAPDTPSELEGGRAMRMTTGDTAECLSVFDLPNKPYERARVPDESQSTVAAEDTGATILAVIDADAAAPLPAAQDGTAAVPGRPIRVALLGGYRIEAASTGEVTVGLRSRARELFAFLVLHPRGVRAASLVETLWPDDEPEKAMHRLHIAVSNLRRVLHTAAGVDPSVIEWVGSLYRPDYDLIDSDVWRFETALSAASRAASDGERAAFLSAATDAYGGDLLDQTTYEWAEPFRVDYRVRAIDAFIKLAELRQAAGEIDAAIEALDAVTRVDPCAEDAHRRLLWLLLAVGRRDAARERWRQLRARLEEIDVDPDAETEAIGRELFTREDGRAAELSGERVTHATQDTLPQHR